MRKVLAQSLFVPLAIALAACGSADTADTAEAPAYSPGQYSTAVGDFARPDADRESDEARKPAELLAFAEIDRGDIVGDYIMGGGYMTRLLAMAVGSRGKVYAFQPEEFIAFRPEYATEQDEATAPYQNVVALRGPLAEPGFPEPLDTIITALNLHDLFADSMPEGTAERTLDALYAALKPGGSLVVVDHRAAEGAGLEAAGSLHRMDMQLALEALTAAGFQFEAEGDIYARSDDPRDANVFDDSIRGRTDQFLLRLRKPA